MQKKWLGMIGVVGIWITAGLALPLVNVLQDWQPEELMVTRGFVTEILALLCLRRMPVKPTKAVLLMGVCFALACLGLYKGIRTWGVSPTIIVVTATPLANFCFTWARGRRVQAGVIASLFALIVGVILALQPWEQHLAFNWTGLGWSLWGMLMNACFYELAARTKNMGKLDRCFWQAIVLAFIGCFANGGLVAHSPSLYSNLLLVVFAIVGGFFYFLANIIAFENLPTNTASVLAQGETPAVIAMATMLLGESLSPVQWIGVGLSLCGAWFCTRWLEEEKIDQ